MAVFTILYGNYYPPDGEFELICIGKFARRTWVNFTQQYGKNRQRCHQNKFTMLYGNYCYIFIENFSQKFSPCINELRWEVLSHPAYSPDIRPCDYHLFRSVQNSLAEQQFQNKVEVRKIVDNFISSTDHAFFSMWDPSIAWALAKSSRSQWYLY